MVACWCCAYILVTHCHYYRFDCPVCLQSITLTDHLGLYRPSKQRRRPFERPRLVRCLVFVLFKLVNNFFVSCLSIANSHGNRSLVVYILTLKPSIEAQCNMPNGIGIIKLMGRSAGFLAAFAALGSGDADVVLVPEVPIVLDGPTGILPFLRQRLKEQGYAVVVVAEVSPVGFSRLYRSADEANSA